MMNAGENYEVKPYPASRMGIHLREIEHGIEMLKLC